MTHPALSDAQNEAFTALFRTIAAPDLARRWLTLLHGKPAKWGKIQPWRCWPGDLYRNWPLGMSREAMRRQSLAQAKRPGPQTWHGLACGHSSPEAVSLPPAEMLVWLDDLVEGFVVLVPKQLALIVNHEDGHWLWTASTRPHVPCRQ